MAIDFNHVPSPCFVLDEARLRANLVRISQVQEPGISVILALKGFAMWSSFPLVKQYVPRATASSLNEARLCFEEMGSKAHTYAPAYLPDEFEQLLSLSSHLTFNSLSEFHRYQKRVAAHPDKVSCGLRVNPEYSVVETPLYDPCSPGSRLGTTAAQLAKEGLPAGIEGLHFHSLCESDSFQLEKTLDSFVDKFGAFLPQIKWVNMGGGHLITKAGYDLPHLQKLLRQFRDTHDVEIILEPGAAFGWQTGVLVGSVLDITENHGIKTAMLDVSFTAHMPDTLEMPYRPRITGAMEAPVNGAPTYRLGGGSCLAGDFLEAYSFEQELQVGDRMVFEDMIHYTMVKTTMFNGVKHPHIAIWREAGHLDVVRRFDYEDFKNRLS